MRQIPGSLRLQRGMTIAEVLAAMVAIVLMVSILAPALGGARSTSGLAVSMQNLATLAAAHASYAADFNGRQPTSVVDDLSAYGGSASNAVTNFAAVNGQAHPPLLLGHCQGVLWGFYLPFDGPASNGQVIVPFDFAQRFGSFRFPNARHLSVYISGRFFEKTFYAPNDPGYPVVESWLNQQCEFTSAAGATLRSSYCTSPAAMFNPAVLSLNTLTNKYYKNPYSIADGFASPAFSQATFPDLKTHLLEHHWNQNTPPNRCNQSFIGGSYAGCEPYFFNHGQASSPATLFYDGHVRQLPVTEAIAANQMVEDQTPGAGNGLWSIDTPLGGSYAPFGSGGYFSAQAYDSTSTSFHILTIDGIQGRDTINLK